MQTKNIKNLRHEMMYPFKRQPYSYSCGASCLETVLTFFGYNVRESEIMKIAGTSKKDGTLIKGIIKVAKKYKLKHKMHENMVIDDIKVCIDKNIPCMLAIQAYRDNKKVKWEDDWNDGHWVVPIGYDNKYIHFEDPACQYRTFLSYNELNKRWHDIDTKDKKLFHFGISFYGKPGRFDEHESIHMD
jgi:predicted double-glycine peptidase